MTPSELQNLLTTLEQRFGTATGSGAEANTIATYTDGVLDCLRWLCEQTPLRDPGAFGYIMNGAVDDDGGRQAS